MYNTVYKFSNLHLILLLKPKLSDFSFGLTLLIPHLCKKVFVQGVRKGELFVHLCHFNLMEKFFPLTPFLFRFCHLVSNMYILFVHNHLGIHDSYHILQTSSPSPRSPLRSSFPLGLIHHLSVWSPLFSVFVTVSVWLYEPVLIHHFKESFLLNFCSSCIYIFSPVLPL